MKVLPSDLPIVCDADGCGQSAAYGISFAEEKVQFRLCKRCLNDLYTGISRVKFEEKHGGKAK